MNALDKLWLEIEALSKRVVPEEMEDEYERGCRETASLFLTMIEEAGGCDPRRNCSRYFFFEGRESNG